MATKIPEQEALNETCRAYNMRRESEGQEERIHPVFILRDKKRSAKSAEYGISASVPVKGEYVYRYITQPVDGLDDISRSALAMNEMLRDAIAGRRVGKLPWHSNGETRNSQKRWSGPFKDAPS